jgi:hypothetical protein
MPYSAAIWGTDFIKARAAERQKAYRARQVAADPDYYKKKYDEAYLMNPKLFSAKTRARQKHVKRATPPWANMKAIERIYQDCPDGFHVDHMIPLRGELVCGLHVENNLQYLPALDNTLKSNNFIEA